MTNELFNEANIYAVAADEKFHLTDEIQEAIRMTLQLNHAVGFLTGRYDENLTISHVSSYFLHNLGYSYDEFLKVSRGSLRHLFYGENQSFLLPDRFRKLHGEGEGEMLSAQGFPLLVHMYKAETKDGKGEPLWILSVYVDQMRENLQLVNQVIHSGFWSIDFDEKGQESHVLYSHDFRHMLGFRDTLDFPNSSDAWIKQIHPDDKERVLRQFYGALQDPTNETKYDIEYRMRLADGSYQWFRDSADVNRRLDGTPSRMVGIFVNVTEEKAKRERAQRSHAFHQAFTASNLCEYYLDLHKDTFDSLKHTPSMLSAYETSRNWESLIQNYLNQYVIDDDKPQVSLFFNRDYMEKKLFYEQEELSLDCRIRLDGEERWVRHVILRDKDISNAHCVIIFIRDITKSKKEAAHVQALTTKTTAMDALLQGATRLVDRMVTADLMKDRYQFYYLKKESPYAATGAFHDFADQVMGLHFHPLAENITWDTLFRPETIRQLLKKPEDIYRIEYASYDNEIYKSLAIAPLSWKEGQLEKIFIMSQVITKEKHMEQESRKALQAACEAANRASQAKTDFLSSMSHDIRTPMNAIIGMTAIAGAHIDNPDRVKDCLGKITQASRHLLGLINEVLDMSRIESGRFSLNEEDFNLSELIDNLLAMNKAEMDRHHHTLQVHLHQVVHENLCGDSLRLQQMLNNIFSNAIKYTPDHGHITLTITERPANSPGIGYYKFEIQDDGIGMTKEFQRIIFQPFTRAENVQAQKIQGTGLGMAIAQNIAHMMNGQIEVESAPEKGSRFLITVALKLQEPSEGIMEKLIHLPVLVIDDDPICRESTVQLLTDIGLDGESVSSGAEAIPLAKERAEKDNNYFAILVDWQMPGMDGLETTRELRKIVGPDVTIIILSAYDFTDIKEAARKAGVNDFITKPLFRSRLLHVMKNLVGGKTGEPQEDHPLDTISQIHLQGKRILLVEDNALNTEIAVEILRLTGAQIDTAKDGKEALDTFLFSTPGYYDLIFMDIQMPIMNGYESTQAIRHLDRPDAKTIPIIAMTANAFAEDITHAKIAGMNEHIAKPLDMTKLYSLLKKWL